MARLILGIGTGRNGSVSLTKLFNKQKNTVAYHEYRFLPRIPNKYMLYKTLFNMAETATNEMPDVHLYKEIQSEMETGEFYNIVALKRFFFKCKAKIIADVGFYWLKYVPEVIKIFPDVRIICQKRDKKETVASWLWKISGHPHQVITLMPFFDYKDMPMSTAILRYWDEYHEAVEKLEKRFPDIIKIFPAFEILNEESWQRKVLGFIGIPESEQVIDTGIHLNASGARKFQYVGRRDDGRTLWKETINQS